MRGTWLALAIQGVPIGDRGPLSLVLDEQLPSGDEDRVLLGFVLDPLT